MADTVTVASRIHTAIAIREPHPHPDKLGAPLDRPLRSAVINGASHPSAVGEIGVTEGVDAELFHNWLTANEELKANGMVYEMSGDDLKALREGRISYGFEPGLKKVIEDNEKAGNADPMKGFEPGPTRAPEPVDMAARSDTPNDDSPRSDVDGMNRTTRSALTSPTAEFATPHAP